MQFGRGVESCAWQIKELTVLMQKSNTIRIGLLKHSSDNKIENELGRRRRGVERLEENIDVKPKKDLNYKSWSKNAQVRKGVVEREPAQLGNRLEVGWEKSVHKMRQMFLDLSH